ncbi:NFkB-p65-degrading zinc protease [Shewanella psychrophila]|uniref:NFkB-p65-degrading zinc protease n=1 Tax=Shewanella psychrophila TaxID=225848 RepID=A0A1S6HW48_9GAMM|nr:M85 family metallopeptidase [Shewanella psychrophila]AQS39806.1 NFkB-p65-degrading zinc protease [Shewanella psychrophila]
MLKYLLFVAIFFQLLLNLRYAIADNGAPDNGSDEYAEFVVSKGAQHKLTHTQMVALSSAISRSVVSSYGRIIDRHTAASIEYTLIDALFLSPTFQSSVSFGIHNGQENIGQIHFSNEYEINEEQNSFSDVDEVEVCDIEDSNAVTSPVIASHEAREDDNGNPIVNIGVAPSIHSSEYPWWQEALIHEVIHHITGSSDPNSEVRHGPTEILAQRIANENNWVIPNFRGYGDTERVKGIEQRNFNSLIQATERHPFEATELMGRMSTISAGLQASTRFDLLTSFCSSNKIDWPPLPDFDDDDFSMGSAFFTGASASNLVDQCSIDVTKRVDTVSEAIEFEGGQLLIQRDFKNLNLLVAKSAFLRAKNGDGFYSKNWDSWKAWYKASSWKHLLGYGLYGYGLEQAKGNDFYNPYGLFFNDGSFSVGVIGTDVKKSTKNDNFTTLAGTNWHTIQYAGQMFFDKNGRPIALVMTDMITGAVGSGWSFIYNHGKWLYEPKDDWDERFFSNSTLSLDSNAPQFNRTNRH